MAADAFAQLQHQPPQPTIIAGVFSKWSVTESIGHGSFSSVRGCTNLVTGLKAVVKSSSFNLRNPATTAPIDPHSATNSKANLSLFAIRELACLIRASTHPNVVSLYDFTIEADTRQAGPMDDGALPVRVHMVLERVEGIELFDYLKSNAGAVSEEEVSGIMAQLMSALAHIHSLSLTHRDIKLDNLLYDRSTGRLVLIDFNLSSFFHPEVPLTEPVGCVHYASPAVLQCAARGKGFGYMPQSGWGDLWGAGVVAYGLLCGYFPFRSSTPPDLLAELTSRTRVDGSIRLDWPSTPPATLSGGRNSAPRAISAIARDFVETLLNPVNRDSLSASFMLCHPFLADQPPLPRATPRARPITDDTLRALCTPSLARQEENVRAWVEEAVRTAVAKREQKTAESRDQYRASTASALKRVPTDPRDLASLANLPPPSHHRRPTSPGPTRIRTTQLYAAQASGRRSPLSPASPVRGGRSPTERTDRASKLNRSASTVSSRHRRAASAVAPGQLAQFGQYVQLVPSFGSKPSMVFAGRGKGQEMP
ncbi:kinase-like protein [Gonapodya prolifera JEL478]|uniref:Kinase-like protein n=1 Tax=Gonapodya prolifera (strain JEL478) TaxID=1344416 RepID=A0A139AX20_GONPJ|nr:kinase-like protein [Gonapodya prolifera JEL478]|eukprot:KXS21268.1 kinase-like protein [Gonapodya prolifera JEL478]